MERFSLVEALADTASGATLSSQTMETSATPQVAKQASWGVLVMLALGQFVMLLDTTVMNTSISQVVRDLGTNVVGLQTVITMYTLFMASFMLLGGKITEMWGAKRAFWIGILVYGAGSLITALAPSLLVLFIGWSVVEGMGAVLVMPSIVALIQSSYSGRQRTMCYGILGGVVGASIAVGPLIGGAATQLASWRVVFAGEFIVLVALMPFLWLIPPTQGQKTRLDIGGAALSALGLAVAVYGVLMSSQWGWIVASPAAPVRPLGLSPTFWLIIVGSLILVGFFAWERRTVARGQQPLLDIAILGVPRMRIGLIVQTSEALTTQAAFFVLPLYLQMVLGMNSFETGLTILPMCVVLFVASLGGASLAGRFPAKGIITIGLATLLCGIVLLLAFVGPRLDVWGFGLGLACMGAGLGLMDSQIYDVIMSSVRAKDSGQAAGLQGTCLNLGGSVGVALVGSVVIAMLAGTFSASVSQNSSFPSQVKQQVQVAATNFPDFVSEKELAAAAASVGVSAEHTAALVKEYVVAQVTALQTGFALLAVLALASLVWFWRLPAIGSAEPDEASEPLEASSDINRLAV